MIVIILIDIKYKLDGNVGPYTIGISIDVLFNLESLINEFEFEKVGRTLMVLLILIIID